MKRALFLIVLVFLLSNCRQESVRNTHFNVAKGSLALCCDASAQDKEYIVYSDYHRWKFLPQQEWVSVLPHDAENDCKFNLLIGENPDTLEREAVVNLLQTGSDKPFCSINIKQEGQMPLCSQKKIVDRMVFSTVCSGDNTHVIQSFGYLQENNTVYFSQQYRTYSNMISWSEPSKTTATTEAPHNMVLNFFSHGNNVSFEYTANGDVYIWTPNYGTRQDDGTYDKPTVVSRIKLVDGGEIANTQTTDNYYFGICSCWSSLDFENGLFAVSDVKYVYIYSLNDLQKLPVEDVQIETEITYGGGASGVPEFTGNPVIKARDCRSVQPLYTIRNTYKSRNLYWQTFRIGGGRLYEFVQNEPVTTGPVVYESFLEVYDIATGALLYSKVPQEYTKDQNWFISRGFTNAEFFCVEPEDLYIREGTLYMMYSVKGNVSPVIRRPVVFKISSKIK